MGTYLNFPRTCGLRLRLFALVIVVLRSALATEPSPHALDADRPKIIRGQKILGNAWSIEGDSTTAAVPAASVLSEKWAWLGRTPGDPGSGERQAQQWQESRTSSMAGAAAAAAAAPLEPAISAEGDSSEGPVPHRLRHNHQRQHQQHRSGSIAASREYYLYNSCSRRHVRMLDSGVDADGGRDDDAARLVLENIGGHLVRIRSQQSGLYLCFNHKGAVVAEVEPTELCLFNETLTESHFTELHLISSDSTVASAASVMFGSDWLIGFRKSGKPWRGYDHKLGRSRRCFQFTKRQMLRSRDDVAGGRTQLLAGGHGNLAAAAAAAAARAAAAAEVPPPEAAAAAAALADDDRDRGGGGLRGSWPDSATAVPPTASGT